MNNVELLLDSARGIYIPRDFVEGFDLPAWGIDPDCWQAKACLDPENDFYWEAWEEIINNAKCRIGERVYTLHQDGDLWAIAYDHMTMEEKNNFGFEEG